MTTKEAIRILSNMIHDNKAVYGDKSKPSIEALELAIQALKMRVNQELQMQLPNGVTYAPKLFNGCAVCDKHKVCFDAFCSNAIHCNAYGVPNFHKENENTYTCCGSCYLCDVADCEESEKGGAE